MNETLESYRAEILVVDDMVPNLKLLTEVLTREGYRVRQSTNGQDALESVRRSQPDLILLDIKMPGMDGLEVCSILKADESLSEIPVIFVTASEDPQGASKGLQLGAVDYILKPFRVDEVLARTKTHVDLSRMRKQLARENEESKARYRRLVEGLKEEYVFYTHDSDGVFTYVSPSIEQVLGYTQEELMVHFTKYLTDNEINKLAQDYSAASMRGEHQPSYQVEIFHKDGSRRWLEIMETPIIGKQGQVISVDGIAHDITERKAAAESLKAANERLEEAQLLGSIGNWEFDLVNDELYWSKQIYKIFGMDPEIFSASYDSFLDTIHPEDREMVDEAYGYSVESGEPYDIVHRIIRKNDGEIRYVHEHSREIRDSNNETIRSIGTVQDVTARILAEQEHKAHQEKLQRAMRQTVQAVALTVEKRDPYTAGHQRRVADLACAIAREMGLDDIRIEGIQLGGMIHDLGKISIPAELLTKPGKLTDSEFNVIKQHATAGYEIVKDIEFPWPVINIVHQHHERLDGSGYPLGLKGEEITLEARILAVADVVEAMSAHRPYRPGLGIEVALEEVERGSGTQYEPDVVAACIRLFKEKNYQLGQE